MFTKRILFCTFAILRLRLGVNILTNFSFLMLEDGLVHVGLELVVCVQGQHRVEKHTVLSKWQVVNFSMVEINPLNRQDVI